MVFYCSSFEKAKYNTAFCFTGLLPETNTDMATIIRTNPKSRAFFLLKTGLSIFLFLQIQMPQAREIVPVKLPHWSLELCRLKKNSCCPKPAHKAPELGLHTVKYS